MQYISHKDNTYYQGDKAHWRDIEATSEPASVYHKPVVENGEHTGWKYDAESARESASLDRESFMLALKKAGIYGQAKQYANNLADDHDWRIRWENSAMFNRTDPDLVAGAKDMGLTDSDLDAIFGITGG